MSKHRETFENDRALIAHLGHSFHQPALLELALTHSSLAYEHNASQGKSTAVITSEDNEQLEFVGDAVLGLIVAEKLYRSFPHLHEGDLTRLRASLVSRKHLAEAAQDIHLGDYLRLGKGEESTGGRRKPALLSNAMEAIVAALYLDGGMSVAASFVSRIIVDPALPALAAVIGEGGAIGDWKSALQEHLQASDLGQARYAVTSESGPDHLKSFAIEVRLEKDGKSTVLGSATAATKKEAQQRAAQVAYQTLCSTTPATPDDGAQL
ncbi:MAG TPA: ribonuclease III [Acidobacteriaceae bacterium]